jgi:DNA-binding transcriptional regulator YiaG
VTPTQIRTLRLALKLSPDAFAAKFGYVGSQSGSNTVYRWETGRRKPSTPVMKMLQPEQASCHAY